MRLFVASLIALASAGWVVPMWFGVEFYLHFWHVEGWPLLLGKPKMNSMDLLAASSACFRLAFMWLGVVLFAWSFVAARKLLAR